MTTKIDKSKLIKGIVDGHKLIPHIDRAIQDKGDFEWQYLHEIKKGDAAFHPSSHCLPSVFELYEMMHGEKEAFPASLHKTFAVGHFWHGYLSHIIVELLGFAAWEDIECPGTRVWGINGDGSPKPYQFSQGKADVVKCSIPKHGDYLLDFKTMNTIDFRTRGLPQRFHEKYIAQINCYLDFFDMDKALIIKIQKDSPHELAEVEVHRNQALIDAIYEKWQVCGYFLAEGITPPPELVIDLPFMV